MPPIWPFKKKQRDDLDEEASATIVYKQGTDPYARQSEHQVDQHAYTDALKLFGDGSSKVEAAADQSVHYDGVVSPTAGDFTADDVESNAASQALETESSPTSSLPEEEKSEWVHHTDGYHYKKLPDGSFEPTAYVKNNDGSYDPYS